MREIELNKDSKIIRGDILRHKSSGDSYIVDRVLSQGRCTLVRTTLMTNPREWVRIDLEAERDDS